MGWQQIWMRTCIAPAWQLRLAGCSCHSCKSTIHKKNPISSCATIFNRTCRNFHMCVSVWVHHVVGRCEIPDAPATFAGISCAAAAAEGTPESIRHAWLEVTAGCIRTACAADRFKRNIMWIQCQTVKLSHGRKLAPAMPTWFLVWSPEATICSELRYAIRKKTPSMPAVTCSLFSASATGSSSACGSKSKSILDHISCTYVEKLTVLMHLRHHARHEMTAGCIRTACAAHLVKSRC